MSLSIARQFRLAMQGVQDRQFPRPAGAATPVIGEADQETTPKPDGIRERIAFALDLLATIAIRDLVDRYAHTASDAAVFGHVRVQAIERNFDPLAHPLLGLERKLLAAEPEIGIGRSAIGN